MVGRTGAGPERPRTLDGWGEVADADRWTITTGGRRSRLDDHHAHTVHEAMFVQGPAGDLFVSVHRPADRSPRAGVVVCPPVLAEAARNYRREHLLATSLAQRGLVVARFHYRGAGHSHDADHVTLDDLVADAEAVTDHLCTSAGITEVSFVATRLGALVAARVRARPHHAGGGLVLWQPVLSATDYLRELHRARLMTNLRQDTRSRPRRRLEQALSEDGAVEIAGHHLEQALHTSIDGAELRSMLDPPTGSLLLIEMSGRLEARPAARELVDAWHVAGQPARLEVVGMDEPWWFGSSARTDTYDAATTGTELVTRSMDFLTEPEGART